MSHNMYLTNVKTGERVNVFSVDKLKEILSRCPYTKFTAEGLTLSYYSEDGVNDESWIAYRGRNMEDLIDLVLSSLS